MIREVQIREVQIREVQIREVQIREVQIIIFLFCSVPNPVVPSVDYTIHYTNISISNCEGIIEKSMNR